MFTGIVTHRGTVRAVQPAPGGARRLVVEPRPAFAALPVGASVAVDGVCLTVAEASEEGLAFDVVPETLRRTTLGRLGPGDAVHLERALRAGDELGGHWVQGHVEGTGEVVVLERRKDADDVCLVLALGPDLFSGMLPKGSVCLDGVSLTVGEAWREAGDEGGRIAVYLVPHTLAVTHLGERGPGARVNVEPDVLGRWIEHHLRRWREAADAWEDGGSVGGRAPGGGA